MKLIIRKETVKNMFLLLYVGLVFFSPIVWFAIGPRLYLLIFVMMLGGVGWLILKNYYLGYQTLITVFLMLSMAAFYFLSNPMDLMGLFSSALPLVSLMFAYWLVRQDPKIVSALAFTVLLSFYLFFLYSMMVHGSTPIDVNNYFEDSSRNTVSAAALFYQILYSASFYRVNQKLPKVTPLFTLLLSVYAYGRTGIALSTALVLFTFVIEFWKSKAVYKIPMILVIMGIFYWLVMNNTLIFDLIYSNTRFSEGLDTPRTLMIKQYLASMGLEEIFIGQDLSNVPIISQADNNPHNFLIYGHSQYGIIYIILIAWIFMVLFWRWSRSKNVMVYSGLIAIFFVRIFFDKLALPGVFDFILFIVFFLIVFEEKKEISEVKIQKI